MGSVVTASADRRAAARTVPPSGWESEVRARVVAGDDLALREVYDQYASFVYGLAARVIGDPRAAEDVSQDVFVQFWERPAAFDPERGSLRTWLGTLTHRRSVDYIRREEARRRRAEHDAAPSREHSRRRGARDGAGLGGAGTRRTRHVARRTATC